MELDLDTFLITVYCLVDELYTRDFGPHKPRRRGRKAGLSDSEVLTLALLAQWEPHRSETAFIEYAVTHWRRYFPQLVSRSDFNRRLRDLSGVLCQLGPALHTLTEQLLGITAAYQVLDCVPVPLMRRCRGNRHRLFGTEASVGRGGSDAEWYYGVKLLGSITPQGTVSGFVLAPANTDDRWVAEALWRWRQEPEAEAPCLEELAPRLGSTHRRHHRRRGPTGPLGPAGSAGAPTDRPYLADLGFRGRVWRAHWRLDYGAAVLLKTDFMGADADPERQRARTWLSHLRQCAETVFQGLSETFGLKFPRARSWWGLLARMGAKVAAFNLAVHINHLYQRPAFDFFNPLA